MAQNGILKSSLAKKYAMAATGLFLCLFLAGHLAGNLQLFTAASDGGRQFNEYAKFMTTFPAVKLLSYLTYFAVLFHLADGMWCCPSKTERLGPCVMPWSVPPPMQDGAAAT